jgi:ankyrin repeat protein
LEAATAGTIELLIAKGATINDEVALSEYRGRQAPVGEISWALINGNDALAAALLARVGMPGAADCGALYYAAQTGSTRTLSALLDLKIDPRATAAFPGMTPLMQAATRPSSNRQEATKELIRHGARLDLRDDFGKTALTYALEANARDTADLLYQSGARP